MKSKGHIPRGIRLSLISLFLVLALSSTEIGIAGAVTLSVDDASGNHSTTVDIPINVSGASNVGAMDISLTYSPSVLSPTGIVDAGDLTAGALVINENTIYINETSIETISEENNQTVWDYGALANYTGTSGVVNISIICNATDVGFNGAGSVAVVRFNVIGSDVESPLNLSVAAYNVSEPIVNTTTGNVTGYEPISVTPLNGTFTAEGSDGHTGDVTSDGYVNYDDVLYMVLNLWGACTPGAEGDVNSDGYVNYDDVLYMVLNLWGACP